MRDKYNILFITSLRGWGGGEIWMLKTAQALRGRGHRTLIVCRTGSRMSLYAEQANQPFKAITFRGDFDLFVIANLIFIFNRFRPDIIIPNLDKEIRLSAIAARLTNSAKIVPRRGNEFPLKDKWRYRIIYNLLVDKLIVNCQATKKVLLNNANWLNSNKIEVIYNGIEIDKFQQRFDTTKLWYEFNIPPEYLVVGMIGELNERKGHIYLFKAAKQIIAQHSKVKFLLVGEGDAETELKTTISRMGLEDNFHFTGFREDIPELLDLIDIVVLPSLNEGTPNAIMEAMAAAKPIVASAVSGTPELVLDNITGFLVPVKNSDKLAEKILTLLNSKDLRTKMGKRGKQRIVESFAFDDMLDRYEELFNRLFNRE
ncbi:MAG: glycosyltransferase [bacterium]|nr:MAG: glycosyltransferase [bacterium]